MGAVTVDLFTTLDLVAQAPGGPEEDPSGGFAFGGWQAPFMDATVGRMVLEGIERIDALLLGRRTYDIWADFWPHREDEADGSIARVFNRIPKYVASRGVLDARWAGTTQLGADLPAAVWALRERYDDVRVIGSLDLVQTLLHERLVDVLNLWVYPLVLGAGKKVFDGGAVPASLTLQQAPVVAESGAVLLSYAVGADAPGTGDMTA